MSHVPKDTELVDDSKTLQKIFRPVFKVKPGVVHYIQTLPRPTDTFTGLFSSCVARVHVCWLCFSGRLTNTSDGPPVSTRYRRTSGNVVNLNSSRRSSSAACFGSGWSEMWFILRFYIHLVRSYPELFRKSLCLKETVLTVHDFKCVALRHSGKSHVNTEMH